MKSNSLRSGFHVFIQFSAILFILVSGSVWPSNLLFLIPEMLGVVLAFWAIWVMRKSVLTVMPEPGAKSVLITSGPYKLVRHPMYSALFLVLIPLVINSYTWLRLAILLLFALNQLLKIIYEEKLLKNHWPEYLVYMRNTWRLIPYLF